DDNHISIEGETRLAFSEDVKKRFDAVGWHTQKIDGHDRGAIRKAIRRAQKVTGRPSLIIARTIIGWGSPKFHGTARAHGEPLGADEVKATKDALGWPQEPTRSEEHTSELQSPYDLVCRLLLEKKKKRKANHTR